MVYRGVCSLSPVAVYLSCFQFPRVHVNQGRTSVEAHLTPAHSRKGNHWARGLSSHVRSLGVRPLDQGKLEWRSPGIRELPCPVYAEGGTASSRHHRASLTRCLSHGHHQPSPRWHSSRDWQPLLLLIQTLTPPTPHPRA